MKVGDLVCPIPPPSDPAVMRSIRAPIVEHPWVGVIIDFEVGEPVVYWSEEFNAEVEYHDELEVINEGR